MKGWRLLIVAASAAAALAVGFAAPAGAHAPVVRDVQIAWDLPVS